MIIPRRFRDARDPSQAKECFRDLVDAYLADPDARHRKGEGVVLAGANGCGKTWTACALALGLGDRLGRRLDVVYGLSAELLDRAYPLGKSPWVGDRDQTFDDAIETCTVLILDDLGHEGRVGGAANVVASKLTRLLRKRSDDLKITFITTNLHLSGDQKPLLSEELGASIESIIHELCPFQLDLEDSVPDLRLKRMRG